MDEKKFKVLPIVLYVFAFVFIILGILGLINITNQVQQAVELQGFSISDNFSYFILMYAEATAQYFIYGVVLMMLALIYNKIDGSVVPQETDKENVTEAEVVQKKKAKQPFNEDEVTDNSMLPQATSVSNDAASTQKGESIILNIDTYALLGAKLCNSQQEDPSLELHEKLMLYRVNVAEEIIKTHSDFDLIYQMLKDSTADLVNNDTDAFLSKTVKEVASMSKLLENNQTIENNIYFMVLFAAQNAWVFRNNTKDGFSRSSIELLKNIESIEGYLLPNGFQDFDPDDIANFSANILICVALWFSDYQDYRCQLRQKILKLLEEGWYSSSEPTSTDAQNAKKSKEMTDDQHK